MNNKTVLVIVVLILIVGGFMIFKNKGEAPVVPTEVQLDSNMPVPGSQVVEKIVVEEGAIVREFQIESTPFKFTPAVMIVNKGDTVKITLKNIKGTHDLKIDELNVATRLLNIGEEETLTFVADKVGTFEYYCSVGSHRAMGMVGTLTVK